MKRAILFLVVSILVLGSWAALADSVPARGCWPDNCLIDCEQCRIVGGCSRCDFCQGVFATARPARPTPGPTAQPTARPTVRPTVQPTARPTVRPTVTPSSSMGDYTTLPASAQEQKVLNLLNADRAANGLPTLTLDPVLSDIARTKACDMRDNRYFAHVSPTYGNAASMLDHFGYAYNGVGENIAHHATVEKAEAAFMSSSGHRHNILGSQWTKVGVGVCYDENGFVYVTQLFVR